MKRSTCIGLCSAMFAATLALAQPAPDYDFDWVTIGAPGNAAYQGLNSEGQPINRGNVDYTYRIAREEVTTAQWLEYVNTFETQSNDLRFFAEPLYWGAEPDPNYQGPGQRWRLRDVPNAAMLPVTGISWRNAAQYCNWLTNGKQTSFASTQGGAYDASTFVNLPGQTYGDQASHSPGALFWIPTLDEWLKAVHYDPNRYGPGQGGWWEASNGSDTLPVPGLPGVGETSAGVNFSPNYSDAWDIPLGAYPDTRTPWGLLDASGGAAEWMEDWWAEAQPPNRWRFWDGDWAGNTFSRDIDYARRMGSDRPNIPLNWIGLRVASIPSLSAGLSLAGSIMVFWSVRRRS